jgi:hypothetical protein
MADEDVAAAVDDSIDLDDAIDLCIEPCRVRDAIARYRAALSEDSGHDQHDNQDSIHADDDAVLEAIADEMDCVYHYALHGSLERYSQRARSLLWEYAGVDDDSIEGLTRARAMLNAGLLDGRGVDGVVDVDGETMIDILGSIYDHPTSHHPLFVSRILPHLRYDE